MKTTTFAVLGLALLLGTAAAAQGPDGGFGGPPPPGGGYGGPRGGGGQFGGRGGGPRGGGGQFGPPPAASAANVPVAALASALNLTATQTAKITSIQTAFQQQRQALRPPFQNGPPDPSTMQDMMTKTKALDAQASADVAAVLTDAQKKALPVFLKQTDTLRGVGIPPELAADLKLTDAQMAVLSKWQAAHPRPQFGQGGPQGGGGGRRGFGGGGGPFGGPPPPDGGDGPPMQ